MPAVEQQECVGKKRHLMAKLVGQLGDRVSKLLQFTKLSCSLFSLLFPASNCRRCLLSCPTAAEVLVSHTTALANHPAIMLSIASHDPTHVVYL